MQLTRTVAPSALPVTIQDVRKQAEYDSDHRDDLITSYIEAAVDLLDGPTGTLGRAIITQTWRLELAAWPAMLVLPVEPVQSVAASYVNAAGAVAQIDASAHYLRHSPGAPSELHWAPGWSAPQLSASVPFPVRFDIVAGFGDADACPPAIKQALRMIVAHWIDVRVPVGDAMQEIPMTANVLLARYRRML